MSRVILLASGGVESSFSLTTLKEHSVLLLHFYYGQASSEREWAAVDSLWNFARGKGWDVRGERRETRIPSNYKGLFLPGRNLYFLLHALNLAADRNYASVAAGFTDRAFGANDGAFSYPDQRPCFVLPFWEAANLANGFFGRKRIDLLLPAANLSKTAMLSDLRSHFPEFQPYTCSKAEPCGTCLSCVNLEKAKAQCGFI